MTYKNCISFVLEHFGVSITITTIRKCLFSLGISLKACKNKGPDQDHGVTERCQAHLDFILHWKEHKIFEHPWKNIICVDFAYNSQRSTRPKCLAPMGGNCLKTEVIAPKYTNCDAVANKPNGERLSTLLFSSDGI